MCSIDHNCFVGPIFLFIISTVPHGTNECQQLLHKLMHGSCEHSWFFKRTHVRAYKKNNFHGYIPLTHETLLHEKFIQKFPYLQ